MEVPDDLANAGAIRDPIDGTLKKGPTVTYKFRDINRKMVEAWETIFNNKPYYQERIQVSAGNMFVDTPHADAIVSPANSFGFMDGGINMAYTRQFGWDMSKRLRKVIVNEHDGELLVGQAIIIPTHVEEEDLPEVHADVTGCEPIKWLISAPTMRVPLVIAESVNVYLAFRAVILTVKKHNADPSKTPIHSVLCPGMGTAVGEMPKERSAHQMMEAFERFDLGLHPLHIEPRNLIKQWQNHQEMAEYAEDTVDAMPPPEDVQHT